MRNKGFVPIILIIIGAVLIGTATLGVIYRKEIGSIFKKAEVKTEPKQEQEAGIIESQKALEEIAKKVEQTTTEQTEQIKQVSESVPKVPATPKPITPEVSQTQQPIIDEELIALRLVYLSWLDFHDKYVINALKNIYQDGAVPMFNNDIEVVDNLTANYNRYIGNNAYSTDEWTNNFYKLAATCNGMNGLLKKLALAGIKTSNDVINGMDADLQYTQSIRDNINNYSKEQLKAGISETNAYFSKLWGDLIKTAQDFIANSESIKNSMKQCSDSMGNALAQPTQITPVFNASNYYGDYGQLLQTFTSTTLSNTLSQINMQSNTISTIPTIVSPNSTGGWSWNVPGGTCMMTTTGYGGYSVGGTACGNYMVSPNGVGGYTITRH